MLIRIDGAGASHELLDWLAGQRLSYSVGFGLTQALVDQLVALPSSDWQAAYNADGEPGRQDADLELRHRRRTRAEDRIRAAKDTGLTNLPLHDLDQNRNLAGGRRAGV